jgi:WD40 repeat protein
MPKCSLLSSVPDVACGDLVSGRELGWGHLVLDGHTSMVNSVTFSPDGSQIVSG